MTTLSKEITFLLFSILIGSVFADTLPTSLIPESSAIPSKLANDNFTEPHQKNFYMGAGIGPGINYFNPNINSVAANNAEHASMAYRIFGGYNLNKIFAIELGYTNFGYYQNSASGNSICNTQGNCGFANPNIFAGVYNTEINAINTITSYSLDLSSISKYNITNNFNIFGKVGVSYLNTSLSTKTIISPQIPIGSTSIGPTFNQTTNANTSLILPLLGFGYEYSPNRYLTLRTEYDYYFSSTMINNQGLNEGTLSSSAIIFSTIYNF